MHWATSYIGLPWRRGATGPDAYDCWSFVAHVQKTHFGRDLPSIDLDESNAFAVSHAISNHPERANWHMVLEPSDGDIVLMARRAAPTHVGVWVKDLHSAGVLHCAEKIGVTFSSVQAVKVMGWGYLSYFRHK